LAKAAIKEAPASETEVAEMPAGGHEILVRTREAVERRGSILLAQLADLEGGPDAERVDEGNAAEPVSASA